MPLFRRPDGDLVKGESLVRRFMPFIMRGRNESCVYHEAQYDIARARLFLRDYNRRNDTQQPATLFHLFLWALGQGMNQRPGLNRFVSGGHIYQRKGVFLTFAAKRAIDDENSPLVTVKLEFPPGEAFGDCVVRIVKGIENARGGAAALVDKELKIMLALPSWLTAGIMTVVRALDRWNLMPGFMIAQDPMYTSVFVSNMGSIGLDRTSHHLYEYGTAAMFACMGAPRKQFFVGRKGEPEVKEILEVRWTLDERVNDGLYSARSLAVLRKLFENPEAAMNPTAVAINAPAPTAEGASLPS